MSEKSPTQRLFEAIKAEFPNAKYVVGDEATDAAIEVSGSIDIQISNEFSSGSYAAVNHYSGAGASFSCASWPMRDQAFPDLHNRIISDIRQAMMPNWKDLLAQAHACNHQA